MLFEKMWRGRYNDRVESHLYAPIPRLAEAITVPTVNAVDPAEVPDREVFSRFEQFLERAFPLVHRILEREELGDPGLLYTWTGRDPTAEPIILTAHYDVVPADAHDGWSHPPFGGAVVDDVIWGRGTLDDKSSLMAILEAATRLMETGFTPERTVLFAFGGDEEVTGQRGAGRIAAALLARGVRALCLVDEGTAVVENTVALVNRPIALIGTAEKGYVDIRLTVQGPDGHASMPPRRTAVGRLARALRRIERQPFPRRLIPSVKAFLVSVADAAPGMYRPILNHPQLFAPILTRVLAGDPKTDALVRTTQAPTMLSGSAAPNVLPAAVEAVVNVRILPGETIESVRRRFVKTVADAEVAVDVLNPAGSGDPVDAAPTHTEVYRQLSGVVLRHFPDAV
ncbi:MAG TPA: M20/M25/M40 family metallo-hydrolase, partial [Alkalispirochaeta sp.]|nr:M20/M25/M40 family metallo-hydrolase [Alkalispirochaeta sp.]